MGFVADKSVMPFWGETGVCVHHLCEETIWQDVPDLHICNMLNWSFQFSFRASAFPVDIFVFLF